MKNTKIRYFASFIFILSLALNGCYRNDLEEYESGSPYLYRIIDGVKTTYTQDPFNPITYKDGKYQGLLANVYNNIEYPAEAKANETKGRVDIHFKIKRDGTVDDVKIEKDIGDGCGEAAAKAVRKATGGHPFNPTGLGFDVYAVLYIYFENY